MKLIGCLANRQRKQQTWWTYEIIFGVKSVTGAGFQALY